MKPIIIDLEQEEMSATRPKPTPPHMSELRGHPVLAALDADLLSRIRARARIVQLQRGEALFEQGEFAEHFYLVRRGQIKLFRIAPDGNEKVIHLAGPGQSFAEAVMFMADRSYPVNTAAVEPAELVAVPIAPLRDTLIDSTEACFSMLAQLSMRLRERVAEIESLALQNGALRLTNFLLRLAADTDATDDVIVLPLSRKVIAARLSLQPETLSRLLRRFEDRGLIQVAGREITVLDRAALDRMALEGDQ